MNKMYKRLYNFIPLVKDDDIFYYIIENGDIGKNHITVYHENGEREDINLINVCGYIQKHDIGKKIVKTEKGNWQIESEEQKFKRINNI